MLRALIRSAILWLSLAGASCAETVTVFAAASLRDALTEIGQDFEVRTGHKVVLSFAGTSVLARQIGFGAPADIFISANSDWMDWLEERGALQSESRIDLLGNFLVLVSRDKIEMTGIADLPELLGQGRLAMALVDAVPAGIYGKAALTSLGLWPQIAPLVVQTDNVRAALALVALGEARFGVVYASDALSEPRVSLVAAFSADTHPAIVYPAARITNTEAAKAFMAHLQDEKALSTFSAYGFHIPEAR